MNFLDVALSCAARGWYVFPCKPRSKDPMTEHAHKDASNNEAQIRAWWTRTPDANVAIAPGHSNLTVLDIDTGLDSEESLREFIAARNLPVTLAVRTGKRPMFRVQLYFSGTTDSFNGWKDGNYSGDKRGSWGYVMAAGCIHPESGERYETLWDNPIQDAPSWVRNLQKDKKQAERILDPTQPITEWRNDAMIRILGDLRARGADDEMIRDFALRTNANPKRFPIPLDEDELERIIQNACKYRQGEPDPVAVIGQPTPKEPVDWRARYATYEQFRDVQPPAFLIQNFLEDGSITAIGAPVAQRKSIVVANVVHALLTGEPLFGHFEVLKQPERILYLCPEMGLVDIANRFKRLGLDSYIGVKLFIRTMDDPKIKLTDLDEELPGSLLILDTITRFVEGNQNDAQDMAKFADICYAIKRRGATMMLLHHAIKGAAGGKMTLDSALRGSTELAAFVTCVWSTQLQDIDAPHTTPSNLKCVKQRGFASEPFQVSCSADYRMKLLGEMGVIKAAKEAEAESALAAILKESPAMGINKLQEALRVAGHRKGGKWITKARAGIVGAGVSLTV
jgi:hypothetical protein